jgi:hypothetical protein
VRPARRDAAAHIDLGGLVVGGEHDGTAENRRISTRSRGADGDVHVAPPDAHDLDHEVAEARAGICPFDRGVLRVGDRLLGDVDTDAEVEVAILPHLGDQHFDQHLQRPDVKLRHRGGDEGEVTLVRANERLLARGSGTIVTSPVKDTPFCAGAPPPMGWACVPNPGPVAVIGGMRWS